MRILHNAQVYTLDPENPRASALAIEGGKVIAIGDDPGIIIDAVKIKAGSPQTPLLEDMSGRTILPGLVDAHIHLQQYAFNLQKVDCETKTMDECLSRVSARVQISPPGSWVYGHGWNQNDWVDGFGSVVDLDNIAQRNPVYLTAKSLHAGWANTQALIAAGINSQTPDPPDGKIERDADGTPTGILLEGAMRMMTETVPESTPDEIRKAILEAQTNLWAMGVTGVHDFDRRECFIALQTLHQEGALRLRVVKSIPLEDMEHAISLGLRSGFGDEMLRIGGVKAFADGALGPHTAAMFEPYENQSSNRGILLLDGETLIEKGSMAVANGLSLAIHAIGDRANHEVINAFGELRAIEKEISSSNSQLPHRIEHVQIIHPDDFPRLSQYNLIASMQPIHATSDMRTADQHWGARSVNAYAWRNILEEGTALIFGSDAPVESPNPFWGLHAAVTRRQADGSPGPDGWYPAQKLTLEEALAAYTTGPARAAGMQDHLGVLAPGYLADLIVLESDLFNCEPEAIKDIQVKATMVAGEWVYVCENL